MTLQNLSEQDKCYDSNLKELIAGEGNAMDPFDQRDSKGQMQRISSQEGLPIDHDKSIARNVQNLLPESPALSVLSNEIWILEYFGQNICADTYAIARAMHGK